MRMFPKIDDEIPKNPFWEGFREGILATAWITVPTSIGILTWITYNFLK